MPKIPKKSAKEEALDSLPQELHPVYFQLINEYQYHCVKLHGRALVSYKILADLIRDGWRPTHEPYAELTFKQSVKSLSSKR